MQNIETNPSRKKFLLWSAVLLAGASAYRFITRKKSCESETVTMLTQDGKLVEINKEMLASSGKKISNEELQNWIKK